MYSRESLLQRLGLQQINNISTCGQQVEYSTDLRVKPFLIRCLFSFVKWNSFFGLYWLFFFMFVIWCASVASNKYYIRTYVLTCDKSTILSHSIGCWFVVYNKLYNKSTQQIEAVEFRPDSASNHNNQFAPHMLTIETVKGECDIARVNNFSRVSSKLIYYIKTDGSIVLYMTPVWSVEWRVLYQWHASYCMSRAHSASLWLISLI